MTLNFLRIMAVLVLLVAGVTLSFCPTVVASLSEPATAGQCCPHDRNEPEVPAPVPDCDGAGCGCVTCLVGILATPTLDISTRVNTVPFSLPGERSPAAGYLATIDYPPETV